MIRKIRRDYINDLMRLGYGTSPGQVINYLVDRQLDDLLRTNVLKNKTDSKVQNTLEEK